MSLARDIMKLLGERDAAREEASRLREGKELLRATMKIKPEEGLASAVARLTAERDQAQKDLQSYEEYLRGIESALHAKKGTAVMTASSLARDRRNVLVQLRRIVIHAERYGITKKSELIADARNLLGLIDSQSEPTAGP